MAKNKKGRKRKTKGLKRMIGVIFLMLVGILYIIKSILYFIDRVIPKLFMKAPRVFRQFVIYSMVILSVLCFVGRDNEVLEKSTNEVTTVIKQVENIINVEAETIVEEEKETETECTMSEIECSIYNEAKHQELSDEQAYMILAISKQETGRWSSYAFKELHNIGGIMGSNGLRKYDTLEDGIKDTVSILKKYYFDMGLDTLEKIQKKYCPVGAENDPSGLNNYWLNNTTVFYNEYLGGK